MQLIYAFAPYFLLIFCRITAFVVTVPILSMRGIPVPLKIGLAFYITLIIFSSMGNVQAIPFDSNYVLLILREVIIGLLIGLSAFLIFVALQVSGAFSDIVVGFGMVNVFDPQTGANSPIIGNFKFMFAVLLFLGIDGHHMLLMAIMNSYKFVPLENQVFAIIASGDIANFLVKSFVYMFYISFQIAAPLIVAIFLVEVSLGILARVAPQFNMFAVGFPLRILVGVLVLGILVPAFVILFRRLFEIMLNSMQDLLYLMGG